MLDSAKGWDYRECGLSHSPMNIVLVIMVWECGYGHAPIVVYGGVFLD